MSFSKLVRFEERGEKYHGDLLEHDTSGFLVTKLHGNLENGFTRTDSEPVRVETLLCPLEHTPIIYCVGLNYHTHAAIMEIEPPSNPPIFCKPPDALASPFQDVHIHPNCQRMLDFEGELAVVIGRDAKNVLEQDALDYVLGYAASNDVSCRDLQAPDVCSYQVGYAKSFDGFAPLGPAIVSAALLRDPQKLRYTVVVNGELRQDISTADMVYSVRRVISHLSTGTTLRCGTVLMMGTGSGVGLDDNRFLKHGDVVTVDVEGVGSISNRMHFD